MKAKTKTGVFRGTILQAAAGSGSTTAQMYALARRLQPGDTVGPKCPHRANNSVNAREWQHVLRSEQQRLKKDGAIKSVGTGRGLVWTAAQEHVTAAEAFEWFEREDR